MGSKSGCAWTAARALPRRPRRHPCHILCSGTTFSERQNGGGGAPRAPRCGRGSKREVAGSSEEDAERVGPKARQSCSCVGSHLLNLRGDGGSAHGYGVDATKGDFGAVECFYEEERSKCGRRALRSSRQYQLDVLDDVPTARKAARRRIFAAASPLPTSLSKYAHSRPASGH